MPVLLHSLRSPVSKSALKMTLAEAESRTQNRLVDRIKGSEYPSSAFDVIWMSRGNVSRLPVCHRGEELGERQTWPPILVYSRFGLPGRTRRWAHCLIMSNPPNSPVRLKDIAQDLNVSVMTVSKVVRGCADV